MFQMVKPEQSAGTRRNGAAELEGMLATPPMENTSAEMAPSTSSGSASTSASPPPGTSRGGALLSYPVVLVKYLNSRDLRHDHGVRQLQGATSAGNSRRAVPDHLALG